MKKRASPQRRRAKPAPAKCDGMPRSAIEAGLADIVAPVGELPGKIIGFLQRPPLIARTELALEGKTLEAKLRANQAGLEKRVADQFTKMQSRKEKVD